MSRCRAFGMEPTDGSLGETHALMATCSALTASAWQEKVYIRLTRIKGNSIRDDGLMNRRCGTTAALLRIVSYHASYILHSPHCAVSHVS